MDFLQQHQVLIILVGLIGSGKTEFAKALTDRYPGIVRYNQDELGDRRHVERKVHETLQAGGSVCVDRTNVDPSQRWTWIDIGRQYPNVDIWCVLLDTPYSICRERLRSRESHPTIKDFDTALKVLNIFSRSFKPPFRSEGFDFVFKLPPTRPRREPMDTENPALPPPSEPTTLSSDVSSSTSSTSWPSSIYSPEDIDRILQSFITASLSPNRLPQVPLPPRPNPPSRSASQNTNESTSINGHGGTDYRRGQPFRGRGGFNTSSNFQPHNGQGFSNWRPRGGPTRALDQNWRQRQNNHGETTRPNLD
ncbi:hypothetical protein FRC03_011045 [Tulasnella sp. 419]|nr:hypothetical protein FRC03_011045 [Tulasnella sp. 419]